MSNLSKGCVAPCSPVDFRGQGPYYSDSDHWRERCQLGEWVGVGEGGGGGGGVRAVCDNNGFSKAIMGSQW